MAGEAVQAIATRPCGAAAAERLRRVGSGHSPPANKGSRQTISRHILFRFDSGTGWPDESGDWKRMGY
jgi:hypothetical protein